MRTGQQMNLLSITHDRWRVSPSDTIVRGRKEGGGGRGWGGEGRSMTTLNRIRLDQCRVTVDWRHERPYPEGMSAHESSTRSKTTNTSEGRKR